MGSVEDYYSEKQQSKGRWMGSGATSLGLEKEAIKYRCEKYKNLINGKSIDGKNELRKGSSTVKIYRNKVTGKIKKKSNPVCGFDNTFSAPKDVSLLWALGDAKTRDTVLRIHQEAVKAASAYIEDNVYVRSHSRNPDGSRTVKWHKAKAVMAAHDHFTSRELDPQIHTHLNLLNIGIREDGKGTGAIDGNKVWKVRYIAGQAYQNTLRNGLERELGITTFDRPFSDEKGVSFGINGISQTQRERFSLRSMQIEKAITHEMTGAQINAVALKTRRAKNCNLTTDELLAEWHNRGKALGFDLEKVLHPERNRATPSEKEVIGKRIVRHCTEKPLDTLKTNIVKKLDQTLDHYFHEKDIDRQADDASHITKEELYLRDLTKSIARKIEAQLEEKQRHRDSLKAYEWNAYLYIKERAKEGMHWKESLKEFTATHEQPYDDYTLSNPNAGTITKNNVHFTYLRFDRHATKEEAEEFTEWFIDEYMNTRVKQENFLGNEKEQKGQHFKPKEEKEYIYSLNEKGQQLAQSKTSKEEAYEKIADLNKRFKTFRQAGTNRYFALKAKQFDGRLKYYRAIGRISRRKYLQLRDQKYLEYNTFKLVTLQVFGVLSARQVRYAMKQQRKEESPYKMVNELERNGIIDKDTAQDLRLNVYKDDMSRRREKELFEDSWKITKYQESQEPIQRNKGKER